MLRAILFDFDGVIVDSENLHFEAFRKVFEEQGVTLARETYFQTCLGFNDVECIRWGLQGTGRIDKAGVLQELARRKSAYYDELLESRMRFFPGVCDFIRGAAGRYPLGIASMALRREIDFALQRAELSDLFCVIVSGEEVEKTKPDPEAYQETLRRMNARLALALDRSIQASECLVIEDSAAGIEAAKRAGMTVIGVTHTEVAPKLWRADRVLASLDGIRLEEVEALFSR